MAAIAEADSEGKNQRIERFLDDCCNTPPVVDTQDEMAPGDDPASESVGLTTCLGRDRRAHGNWRKGEACTPEAQNFVTTSQNLMTTTGTAAAEPQARMAKRAISLSLSRRSRPPKLEPAVAIEKPDEGNQVEQESTGKGSSDENLCDVAKLSSAGNSSSHDNLCDVAKSLSEGSAAHSEHETGSEKSAVSGHTLGLTWSSSFGSVPTPDGARDAGARLEGTAVTKLSLSPGTLCTTEGAGEGRGGGDAVPWPVLPEEGGQQLDSSDIASLSSQADSSPEGPRPRPNLGADVDGDKSTVGGRVPAGETSALGLGGREEFVLGEGASEAETSGHEQSIGGLEGMGGIDGMEGLDSVEASSSTGSRNKGGTAKSEVEAGVDGPMGTKKSKTSKKKGKTKVAGSVKLKRQLSHPVTSGTEPTTSKKKLKKQSTIAGRESGATVGQKGEKARRAHSDGEALSPRKTRKAGALSPGKTRKAGVEKVWSATEASGHTRQRSMSKSKSMQAERPKSAGGVPMKPSLKKASSGTRATSAAIRDARSAMERRRRRMHADITALTEDEGTDVDDRPRTATHHAGKSRGRVHWQLSDDEVDAELDPAGRNDAGHHQGQSPGVSAGTNSRSSGKSSMNGENGARSVADGPRSKRSRSQELKGPGTPRGWHALLAGAVNGAASLPNAWEDRGRAREKENDTFYDASEFLEGSHGDHGGSHAIRKVQTLPPRPKRTGHHLPSVVETPILERVVTAGAGSVLPNAPGSLGPSPSSESLAEVQVPRSADPLHPGAAALPSASKRRALANFRSRLQSDAGAESGGGGTAEGGLLSGRCIAEEMEDPAGLSALGEPRLPSSSGNERDASESLLWNGDGEVEDEGSAARLRACAAAASREQLSECVWEAQLHLVEEQTKQDVAQSKWSSWGQAAASKLSSAASGLSSQAAKVGQAVKSSTALSVKIVSRVLLGWRIKRDKRAHASP